MYILSFIYSYVAVCRFCAVRCLIIICFSLLFSNHSTYVFNILFILVVYFLYSVFLYCFVYFSPFVYSCLILIFVQVCRPLPQSGKQIAVKIFISYHVITLKVVKVYRYWFQKDFEDQ